MGAQETSVRLLPANVRLSPKCSRPCCTEFPWFSNLNVVNGSKKEELLPSFSFLGGFNCETPWSFTSVLGSILKEVASGMAILPALFLFSLESQVLINDSLGEVWATHTRKQIEV